MTRARRSQGKLADPAVKTPPSGGQPEAVSSPVQGGPTKAPQSSRKSETRPKTRRRRKSAAKAPTVGTEAAGSEDDGVVTFNFKDTSSDEQAAVEVAKSGARKPPQRIPDAGKVSAPQLKPTSKDGGEEVSDDPVQAAESNAEAMDAVAVETAEALPPDEEAGKEEEEKTSPAPKKRRSRKRKRRAELKDDSEVEKRPKLDKGISFFCGNLPPGVTKETLTYFLEEEGIHPRVSLHRRQTKENQALTPKQRQYKKNLIKAAKAVHATVVVQTEEEALKMARLDGVNMPSTSHMDWDTELKIVRRLPQSDEFPFKVHVRGLHPSVDDEELKTYLESQDVEPGLALIFRKQKTQISRGFGFVWFKSLSEARKAMGLRRPTLRDRLLVIRPSFKDKKPLKNF